MITHPSFVTTPDRFKKAGALEDEPEQLSRKDRDEIKVRFLYFVALPIVTLYDAPSLTGSSYLRRV